MLIVEQLVEWRLAGETEVFGENVDNTTKPIWPDPGRSGGKPATNRLSYGPARFLLHPFPSYHSTLNILPEET
jgi:hypothetical protein